MKLIFIIICCLILTACPEKTEPKKKQAEQPNDINNVVGCSKELKTCPDGTGVARNPENECQFDACPEIKKKIQDNVMCTQDVKQCPDGTFRGRDPKNNCEFKPCSDSRASEK